MKKFILFSILSIATSWTSAQCDADFTFTVSGNVVNFSNTSSGFMYLEWEFGDGDYSSDFSPSHIYPAVGTYNVCLYVWIADSMSSCVDSTCQQITINDITVDPTVCETDFSLSTNGPQIIATNYSTGATNFSWTVTDYMTGTFLTSATTPDLSYSPGFSSEFEVCLVAYDSLGFACDSVCDYIMIMPDSLDSTAGNLQLNLLNFSLYPNPTNAVLNLKFDHLPSNAHALIVDLLGREMVQIELKSQITEVQVADFPSGIYIVQLIDANQQIIGMHKFVRE